MNTNYDVVVAGLGGMGSAAAAHLARRGLRVLGIEQFERGHELGASAGQSRIIRKAYFESPEYVPLLERAYELWRELQAEYGQQLYIPTGLLTVGASKSPVLSGVREAAQRFNIDIEMLDARQIRERFPMFNVLDAEAATFERDAGYVTPEATIAAHLQRAEKFGAELRFGVTLESWEANDDCVTIRANRENIRASRLVLTLGPWFWKIMKTVGVTLRIQRNIMAWFAPSTPLRAPEMPCFMHDGGTYPALLYGFPDAGNGVKAAFHGRAPATTPQTLDRSIDEEHDVVPLQNALNDFIPGAGSAFLQGKVCMYSMTADEHFIIDAHPQHPNVVVAGGFSGHGFKFVPVVGEIVADLLQHGASPLPIEFLSVRRRELA